MTVCIYLRLGFINLNPLTSMSHKREFLLTIPIQHQTDRDLSGGLRYPTLKQLGPEVYLELIKV